MGTQAENRPCKKLDRQAISVNSGVMGFFKNRYSLLVSFLFSSFLFPYYFYSPFEFLIHPNSCSNPFFPQACLLHDFTYPDQGLPSYDWNFLTVSGGWFAFWLEVLFLFLDYVLFFAVVYLFLLVF